MKNNLIDEFEQFMRKFRKDLMEFLIDEKNIGKLMQFEIPDKFKNNQKDKN